MDEQTLAGLLEQEAAQAVGYSQDEIGAQQDLALQYYHGEPFGDEIAGRSQVVSRDVAEVVDWLMPDLIRIFMSGDEVVAFDPVGQEDEAFAEQATQYVNHVFWRDNPGFRIMHAWFKDALLQKVGVVKVWWDDSERKQRRRYVDQSQEAFDAFLSDDDVEVEDVEVEEIMVGGAPTQVFHFDIVRTMPARVAIEGVPPEEFLVPPRTRSLDSSRYVGHRTRKTRSDLIEMGFDRALVEDLGDGDTDTYGRETTRYRDEPWRAGSDQTYVDPAGQTLWVYEEYVRVDYDGDGKVELRQVFRVGSTILQNDEVADNPFAALCPVPASHRFYGQSVADQLLDLQRIKSVLFRGVLDATYLSNNPRLGVDIAGDGVNLDDVLTSRPGGVIRTKGSPGEKLFPVVHPALPAQSFQMLEYIDTVREGRTGVTRYNQGMDADSLNKTASGMSQIMEAARGRKELIARIFAETGVRDLFRKVLRLLVEHQDRPRMVRLRGEKFVEMDPRGWNAEMDVTINVGIGSGNKDQMMAHLAGIAQKQEGALQIGLPIVTPRHLFHTYSRMVENAGMKNPEQFFLDPEGEEAQQLQEQQRAEAEANPPPPDPTIQLGQMDMQARMAETERKSAADQAKNEIEREKNQIAMQKLVDGQQQFQRDLMAEMQRWHQEHALETRKVLATLAIQRQEVDIKEDAAEAAARAASQSGGEDQQ